MIRSLLRTEASTGVEKSSIVSIQDVDIVWFEASLEQRLVQLLKKRL
jgi:hypothetical protein